jgi:DNA-binding protein WhiA
VELATADRATHSLTYVKSWEAIESLLALMGAAETVLALEERAVVAETRSRANRRANADHANLVRTARTAQRQLAAVQRLRADARLEGLPERLREAAELRIRHPTESLRELAARTDPPATKAALHRRLRALQELAE